MPLDDRTYTELEANLFPSRQVGVVARDREEAAWTIEAAHSAELQTLCAALSRNQSVLVFCDKSLAGFVMQRVLERMRTLQGNFSFLAPVNQAQAISGLVQALAQRLPQLNEAAEPRPLVLQHLDLMAKAPDDRPGTELNNLLFYLYEAPSVVKLAFWDPQFVLPKLLEALFDERISFQSVHRDVLWRLVAANEARKFSDNNKVFTISAQVRLYQNLSGRNVMEVRRILRNTDPSIPDHIETERAFAEVRRQTSAEVPTEAQVVGYSALQDRLEREVLFPLKLRYRAETPDALAQADALMPRGIILAGPPGTGKTEWAKWLALKMGASLWTISGPELKNKFVGETEAAIRRIFQQARRNAPSLIIMDEIDAMTPSRDAGASNFEASMVAQLLSEMSGLRSEEAVLVVGTTNLIDRVDPAFRRPGRFGEDPVMVDYPDSEDRIAIFEHYNKKFNVGLTDDSCRHLAAETAKRRPCSGDHLRAISLWLLREKLLRGEKQNLSWGENEVNNLAFLEEGVSAVLPASQPSAPRSHPRRWTRT